MKLKRRLTPAERAYVIDCQRFGRDHRETLEELGLIEDEPVTAELVKPPPIWRQFLRLARKAPREELDKLPSDGAENHDKYIY